MNKRYRYRDRVTAVGLALIITECLVSPAVGSGSSTITIRRLDPPELGFFSKQVDFKGIPIKAHAVVDDAALIEARRRIARLLESTPVILHNLVEVGAEVQIIGKNQVTSDLPALRHWKGRTYDGDKTIDDRTRGIGGIQASCGEENLLKLPSDRYRHHRDICSHEFAHTIFEYGLSADVRELMREQYKKSTAKGLWKTAYASTNVAEYFAELTMWYVGSRGDFGNIRPRPREGRKWFRVYDPEGFALLDRIYTGRQKVRMITCSVLAARPPSDEPTLHSTDSSSPTKILFDNRTSETFSLYWLDHNGTRKAYGKIRAGSKSQRPTYASHPWLIADSEGNVLAIYVAGGRPGKAILSEDIIDRHHARNEDEVK